MKIGLLGRCLSVLALLLASASPLRADGSGYVSVRELLRTGWGETTPFCEVPDAIVPIAIDAHRTSEAQFAELYTTVTGLEIDARDTHRSLRALRNLQTRTRTTFVPTTSAVSATVVMQAATIGATLEILEEIGWLIIDHLNGTLDPPLCYTVTKRLYAAGVYGALDGAAVALYQSSAFRAKTIGELADHPLFELVDEYITNLGDSVGLAFPDFVEKVGEMLASDYVGKGVCGIYLHIHSIFRDRAETERLAEEIVDGIEGNLTSYAMAASGAGEPVRNAAVRLVDATNVTRALYRSDETPIASGDLSASAAGTYAINVVASNGASTQVISSTTATLVSSGSTTFSVAFSCARVVELFGVTGGDFTIYPVVTAPNGTIWHPDNAPQIGRTAIRIVDRNAARPPTVGLIAQSSGATLVLDVLYADINGDVPASFTVRINNAIVPATPYETTTTRGYERRYSVSQTLAAGFHTVRIDASDGIHTVTKTEQVRHSPNPPRLTLSASPSSVTAGATTTITATLADDAGPLPNETIRFLSSGSGAFTGGVENSLRAITNSSGVATKTFRPASSGTHALSAYWGPSTYGTTSLSVASGAGGLTTTWLFSRTGGTATEATYYVTATIRNNGVPVTYEQGADVTIRVNHGSASKSQDAPNSQGQVQFEYTLTAAEAALGDEVFTLHVDIYDATLIHAVNLQVGAPASFTHVRETTLDGSTSSDDWSHAVAFSRDGQYLARVTDPTIYVHRWSDLSVVRTHTDSNNRGLGIAFSPDSSKVAYGDHRGGVTIIDIAGGTSTRRVITANSADIINIDWYADDRLALSTIAVPGSNYPGRVVIVDAALNTIATVVFPGVTDRDIVRVSCHAGRALCAAATDLDRWFVMRTSGSVFAGPFIHPDNDEVQALAFNAAGDRLLVGGYEDNGSHYVQLYNVTSNGLTFLGSPSTVNNDIFSAAFVSEGGQELLVLSGSHAVEVYRDFLGIPERSGTGLGYAGRFGQSIAFPATGMLAVLSQTRQLFYNLSGDYEGPAISIATVEVPYRETTAALSGTITDPSGVASAEWSRNGGAYGPLTLSPSGAFQIDLAALPVGDTTISIRATDTKWNPSSATVIVTRRADVDPPVVTDVTLAPGTATRTTSIRVEATIRDEDASVASAEAVIVRSGAEVKRVAMTATGDRYGATFDLSDVNAPAGLYSVDIVAIDSSAQNTRTVRGAAAFQLLEPVDPPATVTATATTTSSISITWSAGTGAVSYELYRNSGGGYQLISSPTQTSATDTNVIPDRAYLYRVRSKATDGRTSGDSAPDLATTVIFTDPTITARITLIRATHWIEVRRAADAVRALAGMTPFTYSSAISGMPRGTHVTELRSAITTARTALALTTLPFTDPNVVSGSTAVKAAHLVELRNAVR